MTSFYASVLDCQTISRILTEKTLTNNFEAKKQQKQLKICFLVLQLVIDHSEPFLQVLLGIKLTVVSFLTVIF